MEFAYKRGKRRKEEGEGEEGGEGDSEPADEGPVDQAVALPGQVDEQHDDADEGVENLEEDGTPVEGAEVQQTIRRSHTSAELGSINGHCRLLVAYLLDKAGDLGPCTGACGHSHCLGLQVGATKPVSRQPVNHGQQEHPP